MEKLLKPEYQVGDFVRVERYVSLKAHTEDCYEYTGIVVSKKIKSKAERKVYWFADEYNYLISVPEYGGDYVYVKSDEIAGMINLPIEYKLSMISKFGDWWPKKHRVVLQKVFDQTLQKDKTKMIPEEIVRHIIEFY